MAPHMQCAKVAFRRLVPKMSKSLPSALRTMHSAAPLALMNGRPERCMRIAGQSRFFASADLKVPDLGGESITDGALGEWRFKVGDHVKKGEVVAVIETDKVAIDVVADMDGTITAILAQEEDTVEVGKSIATIEPGAGSGTPSAAPPATTPAAAPASPPSAPSTQPLVGLRATFARLRAQRLGLPDPTAAPAATTSTPKADPAPVAAPAAPEAVSVGDGRTEQRVPVSRVRRVVMDRLRETQKNAALLSTFQEVDMTAVERLQHNYNELFQKSHGTTLGHMSLFVKASALALLEEPGVNAVIDDKETVFRDYVDISVPVESLRGPVSCVLRNVESMSVLEIEKRLAELKKKALRNELSLDELSPCTFGVTESGGMYGTGIINPPQSAVMGINAVTKRPMAVNGKVQARPMMYTSLTYDHRLVDGREAVTFLVSVKNKLEDPARMLIGL